MPDAAHAAEVILRTLHDPAVQRMIAWSTLAGVIVDVIVGLMAGRWSASLLGALSAPARGWTIAFAAGIVHLLLIGGAATGLALAATRIDALLRLWWASGIAIGLGVALVTAILDPAARAAPRRLAGPILVGLAIALAARLLANA